jgi:hypothetical protein
VAPNGITSLPNFINTRPAVLQLKDTDRRADGQTRSVPYAFILYTSCKVYSENHMKLQIHLVGKMQSYRVLIGGTYCSYHGVGKG